MTPRAELESRIDKNLPYLLECSQQLAQTHLPQVLRFQAPGLYDHQTTSSLLSPGRSPAYHFTKQDNLHLVIEDDGDLSLERIETLWREALTKINLPEEDRIEVLYNGQAIEISLTGIPVDDNLPALFSEDDPGHLSLGYSVHWIRGSEPVPDHMQETVYEHTKDIEFWLNKFHSDGLFPSGFSLDKATLCARLHDLGEAVRGDIAALVGKSDQQITEEESDCASVIRGGIGNSYDEETAELLISSYQQYEDIANMESLIVKILDGFSGNMTHFHMEKNLTVEKTLPFSFDRVFRNFGKLKDYSVDFDFEPFKQRLMQFFLPSANWIRFFNANPEIYRPPDIKF